MIINHFFHSPQANYGGVKGKLPKSVVDQDPACVSQSQETGRASEEREDQSSGEEGEEGEEHRAREDPDEMLNQSDDDDDSVRITFLSLSWQHNIGILFSEECNVET